MLDRRYPEVPIWFPGVLLVGVAFAAGLGRPAECASHVPFTDTSRVNIQGARSSGLRQAAKYIGKKRGKTAARSAKHLLDSLGFFNCRWDTLEDGSVTVFPRNRSVISSMEIGGADKVADTVLPSLPPTPRYYNTGELSGLAANLTRSLAQAGYPFAHVVINVSSHIRKPAGEISAQSVQGEKDSLDVVFTAVPDKQYQFAKPIFFGPTATDIGLLSRDIAVREGELFDIRKIEASRLNLVSRLYVDHVSIGDPFISPDTGSGGSGAESVPFGLVTVPFEIADRSGMGIDGAAGFETAQADRPFFHGDLTFSFLNLFRGGEEASLSYSGSRLLQKMHIQVTKPWLFGLPVSLDGSTGLEIEQGNYGFLSGRLAFLADISSQWRLGSAIRAHESTPDSTGISWQFYGADLVLWRSPELPERGVLSREFSIETGSGIVRREQLFTRSHVDFLTGAHLPVFGNQALALRIVSNHLISQERQFAPAELYRIGGYRSVRGYSDGEFPFRTALYGQVEYLYYFSLQGSVFIFVDGGIGFENEVNLENSYYRKLVGHGVGLRVPSKIGNMSVEFARNRNDGKNPGRIHVRLRNVFSGSFGWSR